MRLPTLYRKKKKEAKTQASAPIATGLEFLFECGGKRYYHYPDELLLPVERALTANDVYAELEMRIERNYLEVLLRDSLDLLNQGKIIEAGVLLKYAQQRLEHITHRDLLYKLASVLYIEENEDPRSYSLAYNENKIAHWKAHSQDIDAFFLEKPIGALIPYFATSEQDLKTYSQMQGESLRQMYAYHLRLLSHSSASEDSRATLQLLMQNLGDWKMS